MIKPAQLRAARGLLGWSREELTAASGVSTETIKNIELGRFQPTPETVGKLCLTFVSHGVGFLDLLARHRLWGVVLQPPQASGQDNRLPNEAAHQGEEHLSLVSRMATEIAATIREQGHCRPRDLESKGFTRDQIGRAWLMASALADVELMEPDQ
jgi:transcriptional regulator with XRE-family HTH domain